MVMEFSDLILVNVEWFELESCKGGFVRAYLRTSDEVIVP